MPTVRGDLDRVFSIQTERTVNRHNTVKYKNMTLQIDKQSWCGSPRRASASSSINTLTKR